MRLRLLFFAIISLCLSSLPALADMAVFAALRDNTLYETADGSISNGAGDFLFAGRTANSGVLRRGLIQFDIASIPVGATINSVSFRMNMNRAEIASAANVGLHRVTRAWGEGTSNATGQEGGGAPTTAGDATWIHAISPGTNWSTPGGDFIATASATQLLDADAAYTWTSTSGLVADVQQWVNNPSSNFGWLIRGEESVNGTAMRFISRTGPGGVAVQPSLTIDFTAVPEPSSIFLIGISGLVGIPVVRRTFRRK